MVSVIEFTLYVWFRRADADGAENWMVDNVIPLEREILGATETSRDDHGDGALQLKVWAVMDGIVYLSSEIFRDPELPCWFLSFCLQTRKLEKLFHKTFDNGVFPYVMAWPPSLVGNNASP
uniref:Uncharacterized protein n=1 Tax=Arundo donax TaxID=35708 RepID=A0A0A9TJ05_ARUDO